MCVGEERGLTRVAEDRDKRGEDLAGGGDSGEQQRRELGDGEVDEALAHGRAQREGHQCLDKLLQHVYGCGFARARVLACVRACVRMQLEGWKGRT